MWRHLINKQFHQPQLSANKDRQGLVQACLLCSKRSANRVFLFRFKGIVNVAVHQARLTCGKSSLLLAYGTWTNVIVCMLCKNTEELQCDVVRRRTNALLSQQNDFYINACHRLAEHVRRDMRSYISAAVLCYLI